MVAHCHSAACSPRVLTLLLRGLTAELLLSPMSSPSQADASQHAASHPQHSQQRSHHSQQLQHSQQHSGHLLPVISQQQPTTPSSVQRLVITSALFKVPGQQQQQQQRVRWQQQPCSSAGALEEAERQHAIGGGRRLGSMEAGQGSRQQLLRLHQQLQQQQQQQQQGLEPAAGAKLLSAGAHEGTPSPSSTSTLLASLLERHKAGSHAPPGSMAAAGPAPAALPGQHPATSLGSDDELDALWQELLLQPGTACPARQQHAQQYPHQHQQARYPGQQHPAAGYTSAVPSAAGQEAEEEEEELAGPQGKVPRLATVHKRALDALLNPRTSPPAGYSQLPAPSQQQLQPLLPASLQQAAAAEGSAGAAALPSPGLFQLPPLAVQARLSWPLGLAGAAAGGGTPDSTGADFAALLASLGGGSSPAAGSPGRQASWAAGLFEDAVAAGGAAAGSAVQQGAAAVQQQQQQQQQLDGSSGGNHAVAAAGLPGTGAWQVDKVQPAAEGLAGLPAAAGAWEGLELLLPHVGMQQLLGMPRQ